MGQCVEKLFKLLDKFAERTVPVPGFDEKLFLELVGGFIWKG